MVTKAELRSQLSMVMGRPVLDAAVAPLAFATGNALAGPAAGTTAAVSIGLVMVLFRLARGRLLRFAAAGLGGTAVAAAATLLGGRPEAFFLPGILAGFATGLLAFLSVAVRRPLVAWTSRLVRGWPAGWYRHPLVHPAYRDVTLAWGFFFVARAGLQLGLAVRGEIELLAGSRLLLGWPAWVLLLAASYLYGVKRLGTLAGPSVEEFRAGAVPPWTGRQRGF